MAVAIAVNRDTLPENAQKNPPTVCERFLSTVLVLFTANIKSLSIYYNRCSPVKSTVDYIMVRQEDKAKIQATSIHLINRLTLLHSALNAACSNPVYIVSGISSN